MPRRKSKRTPSQKDLPRSCSGSTATSLRIGQLAFRKDFDVEDQSSDGGSVETFLDSVGELITSKDPWYFRGPQFMWVERIPYSDGDDSTESESEALGDTDDGSSDSDVTSSSEEDEPKPMEKTAEEDEDESSPECADVVESTIKTDLSRSRTCVSVCDESRSVSNVNLKPKTVAFTSGFDSTESLSLRSIKKPTITAEGDMDDVFDANQMKAQKEALFYQKLAEFEDDATDSESQGKRDAQMEQELTKAQYWKIRKIIKFLKMADEEGTSISLSILMGCDLSNADYHEALEDTGAMEMFVNLLTTQSNSCRVMSLHVIDAITEVNYDMCELALDLGIAEDIKTNLNSSDDTEVLAAIKCLMNLLCIKRARTIIRKTNLIPTIFQLVYRLPMSVLREKLCEYFDEKIHKRYEIALGALYIITSLMRSPKVKNTLFDCGYHSLLVPLLGSKESAVIKAILEGIVLCTTLKKFRMRFEIENLIKLSLKHWQKNEELVLKFLYRMSIGIDAREQIIKHDGLAKVVNFIQDENNMHKDPYGFKYALSCLYRLGAHPKARDVFNSVRLHEPLIKLLKVGHPSYRKPISGLLSEMSIFPENWPSLVRLGGFEEILKIILSTISDLWLLANCLKILGDVAHARDAREVLVNFPEILPYLLSLLNDDRPMITRCAAKALVPLTRIYGDYAEVLKSDQDSLEVAMERLKGDDDGVKSAVCEALAACMLEDSILHIIHDLGLQQQLCKLIHSNNELLQENVCGLISLCVELPEARTEFAQHGIVERLAQVVFSPNIHVVIAAVGALWRLSCEASNALRLHETGIVQKLIELATNEYEELSTSALGCLQNIRIAVLAPEMSEVLADDEDAVRTTVPPPKHFPYVFKPQLFFHDEIELP